MPSQEQIPDHGHGRLAQWPASQESLKVSMMAARQCTARRKDGRPCQAWAMHGSDPPRCVVHRQWTPPEEGTIESLPDRKPADDKQPAAGSESEPEDFYRLAYTMREIADLLQTAAEGDLRDEMTAARVAVRRVLQQLAEELSPAEYARMASLIFRGTSTIAGLMRTQRHLSQKASEELVAAFNQALDEVGQEMGVDL